jgi:hypothetical protein
MAVKSGKGLVGCEGSGLMSLPSAAMDSVEKIYAVRSRHDFARQCPTVMRSAAVGYD